MTAMSAIKINAQENSLKHQGFPKRRSKEGVIVSSDGLRFRFPDSNRLLEVVSRICQGFANVDPESIWFIPE
jgi:hypothetical protein